MESSLRASSFYESPSTIWWSLKRRISVSTGVALVSALVEHLLVLAKQSEKTTYEIEVCKWTRGNVCFVENFISKDMSYVFNYVKYNHFFGLLAEYVKVSCTFYWSFLDIFIMIVSIGLAYYYELINNRIKFFRGRVIPEATWIEVRKNYAAVSELLKFVDKEMEKIIVLACCNDSYFIIVQLMNLSR